MRGREGKGGAPPTDLLVCFPSRTHLALMPKPICSPARPMDSTKRHNNKQHHHHHLGRSSNRIGRAASPVLWAKTKSMECDMSEPTSPKVSCAGQIKVRSKTDSCKNWQSVMEEIERLHTNRKQKKRRPTWIEALGLKKDVMQFLSCLRGLRFDLRCFGSFHESVITSDDEEEEEEDECEEKEYQHNHEQDHQERGIDSADGDGSCSSKTVYSKWFMVLEENHQDHRCIKEDQEENDDEESLPCVPPPNALLLMRCRSAPAPSKSSLEEKLRQEQKEEEEEKKAKLALEEKKEKESLIFKYYAPDFFKVSSDIAKETWVVGGARDPFSRSRSWKR